MRVLGLQEEPVAVPALWIWHRRSVGRTASFSKTAWVTLSFWNSGESKAGVREDATASPRLAPRTNPEPVPNPRSPPVQEVSTSLSRTLRRQKLLRPSTFDGFASPRCPSAAFPARRFALWKFGTSPGTEHRRAPGEDGTRDRNRSTFLSSSFVYEQSHRRHAGRTLSGHDGPGNQRHLGRRENDQTAATPARQVSA